MSNFPFLLTRKSVQWTLLSKESIALLRLLQLIGWWQPAVLSPSMNQALVEVSVGNTHTNGDCSRYLFAAGILIRTCGQGALLASQIRARNLIPWTNFPNTRPTQKLATSWVNIKWAESLTNLYQNTLGYITELPAFRWPLLPLFWDDCLESKLSLAQWCVTLTERHHQLVHSGIPLPTVLCMAAIFVGGKDPAPTCCWDVMSTPSKKKLCHYARNRDVHTVALNPCS